MRALEHSKSPEKSSIFAGFVLRFGGIHATKCLLHWIPIDFIDLRGQKLSNIVNFLSAGFWIRIEPIFWNRVQNIIWCAHKKDFRVKISRNSSSMFILSGYHHTITPEQAKSMKFDENQWKSSILLCFHHRQIEQLCEFFICRFLKSDQVNFLESCSKYNLMCT